MLFMLQQWCLGALACFVPGNLCARSKRDFVPMTLHCPQEKDGRGDKSSETTHKQVGNWGSLKLTHHPKYFKDDMPALTLSTTFSPPHASSS